MQAKKKDWNVTDLSKINQLSTDRGDMANNMIMPFDSTSTCTINDENLSWDKRNEGNGDLEVYRTCDKNVMSNNENYEPVSNEECRCSSAICESYRDQLRQIILDHQKGHCGKSSYRLPLQCSLQSSPDLGGGPHLNFSALASKLIEYLNVDIRLKFTLTFETETLFLILRLIVILKKLVLRQENISKHNASFK